MAWLDPEDEAITTESTAPRSENAPPSSRKKPPRLPGAAMTLPPMPVVGPKTERPPSLPARRMTTEVDMQWVELVDNDDAVPTSAKKRRASSLPPKSVQDATKPRPVSKKPIRREDDE